MSWQVDGHYYHDYSEYQRALQARDMRLAQGQVDSLRQEMAQHARRAREAEAGLAEARGDIARQRRLQEALDASVADLRRSQERMAQAQRTMEEEMERQFRATREDLAETNRQVSQLGCQLDTTQDNLARLEEEHRRHVEAVRAGFAQAHEEMTRGLAEAEERRKRGEALLREEIGKVNDKVEVDRKERLEKAQGEVGRAGAMVAFIAERLEVVRRDQDLLELKGEVDAIDQELAQARARLADGDTSSALSLSSGAYARLRTAENLAIARKAELDFAVERMKDTIAVVREQLARVDDAGENLIRTFFALETSEAEAILATIEERIPAIYGRYRQMFGQRPAEEADLDEVREVVRGLTVAAPLVQGYFEERNAKIGRIIRDLKLEFGRDTSIQAKLADESDPKSTLQIDCDFGGRSVRVLIPIEPDAVFQTDGYGHETDPDCQANGLRVARVLAQEARITGVRSDQHSRSTPRIEAEARPSPWAGLSERLAKVHKRA